MWREIRSDFPISAKRIYLDHASGGPIPAPVHEKIKLYYEEHFREADYAWPRWIRRREEVRAKAAKFIGAEPGEIAFIHSTSQGINLIADMLAPQGAVLTNASEFPTSTLPWLWRKTKVVWQKPERGKIPLSQLRSLLTPRVKTVVTSLVQYATGFRQDVAALSRMKGDRYLVVNATQALGALDVNVKRLGADFLCSNSYKWFMAGYGGGILYVKKKWLAKFRPAFVGWRSMREPDAMNNRKLDLSPDAARYEPGCPAFPNIFAFGAALDYFSGIGIKKIEARVLELTGLAIQGLDRLGFEVVSPREPQHRSGIVVFKTGAAENIRAKLLARGIYVSCRGEGIRVAPHFYNSEDEIQIFLKELAKARP